MSSESFGGVADALFCWNDRLDRADYVMARYRIASRVEPARAAFAMAREQSACTDRVPDGAEARALLARATARVVSVEAVAAGAGEALPAYRLTTPVYGAASDWRETPLAAEVVIAFPWRNFGASATRMLNHVGGELTRLGFLGAVRLLRLELPPDLVARFAGPRIGTTGMRDSLGIHGRPLFCRSTRPAVGISLDAMRAANRAVLEGGFDLVKDDELSGTGDAGQDAMRFAALQADVDAIGAEVGERKGYFVSLLDDPAASDALARAACESRVLGALVAPGLQGFGALGATGERGLAVLAHNSGSDVRTRSPLIGMHPAVWTLLCRLAGADCIMLPGEFATAGMSREDARACVDAASAPLGALRAALPILAGGKRADALAEYVDWVGSADFMLIVAAAVDEHPDGPRAGARAFREAWRALRT